ncbi:O-antigen ligase family protein [Virgibacillus salinus]
MIFRVINIYSIILLFIVIYDTNSRTTILALLFVLFIYSFWNKICNYIKPVIISIVALSILITFFYIKIKGTEIGTYLNEVSLKYTDKSLFSGRQRLWEGAINNVVDSDKVLLGLGNNVQFELLNGYLHSLYVQLFYQGGLVGLLLFMCVLWIIMSLIKETKNVSTDHRLKTLVSFFIGILILQVFEGQLIYSFSVISVLSWLILALLVNKALFYIKDQNV